jgi:hypothetical protein
MSYAAKTLLAFGVYLLGLGSLLVFVPNLLLAIFGVQSTSEVWIRIVGMLLLILGTYDILAAKTGFRQFFVWSVLGRDRLFPSFCAPRPWSACLVALWRYRRGMRDLDVDGPEERRLKKPTMLHWYPMAGETRRRHW